MEVEDGERRIRLAGRIDRVDLIRDTHAALVIDYKRSARPLRSRVDQGLEFQLPIYLLAVRRLLGLDGVAAELRILREPKKGEGLYLEEAKGPLGLGRKSVYTREEWETLLSVTEERIRRVTRRMEEGDISIRSKSCAHCSFDAVCRFEKWRQPYTRG